MAPPTDSLIEALQRRDPHALTLIVKDHARAVYRAARGMGFQATEAEDLTQDVFLTFLETLDRFEGRSLVSTWLFGILYRKGLERRRAFRRAEQQPDPVDDGFDARFDMAGAWARPPVAAERLVASKEAARALRECMGALPEGQREVVHLRQVEELSAADAASVLGLTINHIGVLLHRGRLALRRCLEGKGHVRS